uniref:Uncharacterized protein n=1 Tax=Anguilla anguilla TaxID=7936 RepID=A0A0E9VK16_ANGAN
MSLTVILPDNYFTRSSQFSDIFIILTSHESSCMYTGK